MRGAEVEAMPAGRTTRRALGSKERLIWRRCCLANVVTVLVRDLRLKLAINIEESTGKRGEVTSWNTSVNVSGDVIAECNQELSPAFLGGLINTHMHS